MSHIRKTISTTESFDVEVKINQEDIIKYIKNSGASNYELKEIIRAATKEANEDEEIFKIETLDEVFKSKLFKEAFKKYSLIQLENLFKL